MKLLAFILVTRLGVLVDYARLRSTVLDPLQHDSVLRQILEERLYLSRAIGSTCEAFLTEEVTVLLVQNKTAALIRIQAF